MSSKPSFSTHAGPHGPFLTSPRSMRTFNDQAKRVLLQLPGGLEGEFHGRPGPIVREVEAPLREGCQRYCVPANPPLLIHPCHQYGPWSKGPDTGGYDRTRRISELRDAQRLGGSVRVIDVPNRPVTTLLE